MHRGVDNTHQRVCTLGQLMEDALAPVVAVEASGQNWFSVIGILVDMDPECDMIPPLLPPLLVVDSALVVEEVPAVVERSVEDFHPDTFDPVLSAQQSVAGQDDL
jgi:hypothetical protein